MLSLLKNSCKNAYSESNSHSWPDSCHWKCMVLLSSEHSSVPRGTSVCPQSSLRHFLMRVCQIPHSFPTPYSTSSSVTLSNKSCQQILEKIVAKREFPQFLPLNLKLDLHLHYYVPFPQFQWRVSHSSKAASSVCIWITFCLTSSRTTSLTVSSLCIFNLLYRFVNISI